jgi:hypothetical protein
MIMNREARGEFLEAFDAHRVQDQMSFYRAREEEYRRADAQAGAVTEVLLFLAGVSGIVAVMWSSQAFWLGVAAATLAALATVVGAWAELIGFSKNAQLYGAARASLDYLRPDRPQGSEVKKAPVRAYVRDVEDILLGEVRSWGEQWERTDDAASTSG